MNFVLQTIIMLSLGVMVYMVARKVPQLGDALDTKGPSGFGAKFDNFFKSIPLDKLDFILTQALEKFLRKSRIFLLKLDNKLVHHLEKFKRMKRSQEQMKAKKFELFEKGDLMNDGAEIIKEEKPEEEDKGEIINN